MQVIFSTLSRQLNKFSEHETFHRISRTVKNIILQLSFAWKLTRSTDCKKEQAYTIISLLPYLENVSHLSSNILL